jgi:transcription factor C subunit 3
MLFGTSNENYLPSKGAALLRSAGKRTVSRARDGLLGRGVLSKLVKDSQKPKPGRTLKISEM